MVHHENDGTDIERRSQCELRVPRVGAAAREDGQRHDNTLPVRQLESGAGRASGGTPTANPLTGPAIDETLTGTDANGTSTLLVDALGSALALSDAAGSLQTTYAYEPWPDVLLGLLRPCWEFVPRLRIVDAPP